MEEHDILVSMTADQWLRFWDLRDLASKGPIFKMNADHGTGIDEQLTGIAFTKDNKEFVTTDTMGRIKKFDCSAITDWRTDSNIMEKIKVPYYINAHRSLISSVEIIEKRTQEEIEEEERKEAEDDPDDIEELDIPDEPYKPWPDRFILTASNDRNIFLHRLSTGVKVHQFDQGNHFNIYDMSPYRKTLPNYERNFLAEKKVLVRERMEAMMLKAQELGILDTNEEVKARGATTREKLRSLGLKYAEMKNDDSFEKELDGIYEDLEEEAIVTSEEDEEWDYLKGINLEEAVRRQHKKDPNYLKHR